MNTKVYCGRTGIEHNCAVARSDNTYSCSTSGSQICDNTFLLPTNEPTESPSESTTNPSGSPTTTSPTTSPTSAPSSAPSVAPSAAPTQSPTICADLPFTDNVSHDGKDITNGSISDLLAMLLISNVSEIYNYSYNEPGFRSTINCTLDEYICYIQCIQNRTSCGESNIFIDANSSELSQLELHCYGESSCDQSNVNLTGVELDSVVIACYSIDSCQNVNVYIANASIRNVSILCQDRGSCSSLFVESISSNISLTIGCLNDYTCDDMTIEGDNGMVIDMIMYKYSNDIKIIHPNISNINLVCDNPKNKRYIRYNIEAIPDEFDLMKQARLEYDSLYLPCEGIAVHCTENDYFPKSCEYNYEWNSDFDLSSLLQTKEYIDCYWFEVSQAFDINCDGNCYDPIEIYNYNITIDFDIFFNFEKVQNMSAAKKAFLTCDHYFGDVNDTEDTLRNIDGLFSYVFSIISRSNPFKIYEMLSLPSTSLATGSMEINCTYNFSNIQITTSIPLLSGIDGEKEFYKLFDDGSDFHNDLEQLLSDFFQVPISIDRTVSVTDDIEQIIDGIAVKYVLLITGCSICFIIMLLCAFIWNKRNRMKKLAFLTTWIKNPLVIAIAIGKYESNPKNSALAASMTFDNLESIHNDIRNLVKLFGTALNYTISPQYDLNNVIKTHWTEQEIITLLKKRAHELEQGVKQQLYDALIVVISCHGIQDHIVTSDYKKINKDTIHRIFSVDHPSLRDIPCMFIYDCCDGSNDMNRDQGRIDTEHAILDSQISKGSYHHLDLNKHSVVDAYGTNKDIWFKGEVNPDYKLVIINSSNTGFASQMGSESGSYMIRMFTEKVMNNLDQNKKFLFEIFHEIQEELHAKDIQLIEAKYNNKLEYIKFCKNNGAEIVRMSNNRPEKSMKSQIATPGMTEEQEQKFNNDEMVMISGMDLQKSIISDEDDVESDEKEMLMDNNKVIEMEELDRKKSGIVKKLSNHISGHNELSTMGSNKSNKKESRTDDLALFENPQSTRL